jgi:hypothetical protein
MSFLNANVPALRVWADERHVTQDHAAGLTRAEADVVGVKCVPGRPLAFHLLFRDGAVYGDVPIHALASDPDVEPLEADQASAWDCFGYHFGVVEYARLAGLLADLTIPRHGPEVARYLFTVDFCRPDPNVVDPSVAEYPPERKCTHVLVAAPGWLLAMPNNRLRWRDPAFVTEPPARCYRRAEEDESAEALAAIHAGPAGGTARET